MENGDALAKPLPEPRCENWCQRDLRDEQQRLIEAHRALLRDKLQGEIEALAAG